MSKKTHDLYDFGEFRLDPAERVLYRNGELLTLAPKVFDTLEVLVESEGKLLSKAELMDAVWKDSFVEESNLTQNIYTLRRLFGKRNQFIKTVPRRGYRFAVDVRRVSRDDERDEQIVTEGPGDVLIAQTDPLRIPEEEVVGDAPEFDRIPVPAQGHKFFSGRILYPFAVAVFIAVSLVVLLGFSYLNRSSNEMDAPVAKARFTSLTDTGDVLALAVSPNGRFLAYASEEPDSGKQLRLKDLELDQDVSLDVSASVAPTFLRFSPDGDHIYFKDAGSTRDASDVFRTTRFGGETELVAKDVASEFSFSKDGTKMAFVRRDIKTNAHTLIIRDLSNGKERELATRELPDGFSLISAPVFSPSGTKVHVLTTPQKSSTSEIVSIGLKNLEETRIETPKELKHFIQLEATPAENEIIAAARRDGEYAQIYKVRLEDGSVRRITNDLNLYRKISVSGDGKSIAALNILNYSNLLLLPDARSENARPLTSGTFGRYGRHGLELLSDSVVAYVSVVSGNREIWTLDIDNGSRNQLTSGERVYSQDPVAARGGRHIYFVFGNDRSREIARMDFDGQNRKTITTGDSGLDLFPAVAPDESAVYFIRQERGRSSVMKMDLPDGTPRELPLPEGIIPGEFLRLSPDGSLLAFGLAHEDLDRAEPGQLAVGVVSLDASFSGMRLFKIKASRPMIRWTGAGDAFDFVLNAQGSAFIMRQSIHSDVRPEPVAELDGVEVHDFLWIPQRKDLLISDRVSRQDAVLITDFQ